MTTEFEGSCLSWTMMTAAPGEVVSRRAVKPTQMRTTQIRAPRSAAYDMGCVGAAGGSPSSSDRASWVRASPVVNVFVAEAAAQPLTRPAWRMGERKAGRGSPVPTSPHPSLARTLMAVLMKTRA